MRSGTEGSNALWSRLTSARSSSRCLTIRLALTADAIDPAASAPARVPSASRPAQTPSGTSRSTFVTNVGLSGMSVVVRGGLYVEAGSFRGLRRFLRDFGFFLGVTARPDVLVMLGVDSGRYV